MSEIVNRVSESGLLTLDLENFVSSNEIVEVDIAEQLWQGLALKEKDFREWIKTNDWSIFKDKNVYIHCSVDAIIPSWAYMLIASSLVPFTDSFIAGSKGSLEEKIIKENISKIDLEELENFFCLLNSCLKENFLSSSCSFLKLSSNRSLLYNFFNIKKTKFKFAPSFFNLIWFVK